MLKKELAAAKDRPFIENIYGEFLLQLKVEKIGLFFFLDGQSMHRPSKEEWLGKVDLLPNGCKKF